MGSSNNRPSCLESLRLEYIGNFDGLQASKPKSSKILRAYLRWQREIPVDFLAISKLKKNFKLPKPLNLNCWLSSVKEEKASASFLARTMLST